MTPIAQSETQPVLQASVTSSVVRHRSATRPQSWNGPLFACALFGLIE